MKTARYMKNKPTVIAIAAVGEKTRAIGKDNELLWRIPDDLKRFKRITSGHPIIMGRKTFESIGRPLPNRTNIVLTTDPDYFAEGILVAHSIEDALEQGKKHDKEEIYIIGGASIYKQAMPYTDKLLLTLVKSTDEGDTYFPDYSDFTKVVKSEEYVNEEPPYTFVELERA
jgi:dihydrofolate reductase